MNTKRKIQLIGSDSGGTMTDTFIVDDKGDFVIGKAPTTNQNLAIGFWDSLSQGAGYWQIDWSKDSKNILPQAETCVYSGTTIINTFITGTGRRLGLICTKGMEDVLLQERGKQTYACYVWEDRLHYASHIHNEPLIPKKLIRGVTERISVLGEPAIPLYEHEAADAVEQLLSKGVEGIIVWLICSYLNPMHELAIGNIAAEVMKRQGRQVPVYLSSVICPLRGEMARLTSTLLQAYAAEPARRQLLGIEERLRGDGYRHPLQIVLSSGGIANARYPRLQESAMSGPVGGMMGGQYLAEIMGIPNLVCTDVGGTTLDVGLLTGGKPTLTREVEMARYIFNIPTVVVDSSGAGMGMYVTLDPETKRVEVGPGSAGAEPGPVCYKRGNEVPTVMDCSLVLGLLDPNYHLGGKLKLHKDLALRAIMEKCAEPLGVDVHDFAEGVIDLITLRMKEHIRSVIGVRGLSPADYCLIAYGGAGPMFVAGYTDGLPLKGVFTVPFAAAFSAFGCTSLDYVHVYQKSTGLVIPWGANDDFKMFMGSLLNMGWEDLEGLALRELKEEGFDEAAIKLEQIAYVRYFNQMEEVEVESPVRRVKSGRDMDSIVDTFEKRYSSLYSLVARYPETGYQILELGIRASVAKPKPVIRKYALEGKLPSGNARKGVRDVYKGRQWRSASLYEMELLRPGNEVRGLAVIESPTTTFVVPEGKKTRVDEYGFFWLEGDRE